MRVMIFGAGGLGAVVADLVRANGHSVAGFVDVDEALMGREVEPGGGRVLMTDDEFFEVLDEQEDFDAVALAVTDNKARLRLFFELSESVALPPFVHPSAIVSEHATVGKGTIVLPRAVVAPGASVGRAAVIGTAAVVDAHASVGDAVTVDTHATVCRGVSIGDRTLIGCGVVAARDVPEDQAR